MDNDHKYRLNVGIMLMNESNEVFIGKRFDIIKEYSWQMPQGGIDQNESPQEAAMRELKEEIGTNYASIISESQNWYYYDIPLELMENQYDKKYMGKYIGQKQKWFLMKFLGKDSDINLYTEVPEFSEWKWINIAELPNLVVPFKKKTYISIINEFQGSISPQFK